MGYCPFSQFESRYNFCIVTQGNTVGMGGQGIGHNTARVRPRHSQECSMIRPTAHACCLAGGECCDTKFCIVTGARACPLGGCFTIQSLYRDRRAVWLARHGTIQMIVSSRGKAWPLGCVVTRPAIRQRHGCDITQDAPRYGVEGP